MKEAHNFLPHHALSFRTNPWTLSSICCADNVRHVQSASLQTHQENKIGIIKEKEFSKKKKNQQVTSASLVFAAETPAVNVATPNGVRPTSASPPLKTPPPKKKERGQITVAIYASLILPFFFLKKNQTCFELFSECVAITPLSRTSPPQRHYLTVKVPYGESWNYSSFRPSSLGDNTQKKMSKNDVKTFS